jgi:hypothetical protein
MERTLFLTSTGFDSLLAFDLDSGQTVASVNLTMDIRNAIRGLEPWPIED